jgi:site-specific DNA-methyltransferase (adenine-specific)/modification methylase
MPRNKNLHFINSTESWLYFTKITKTGVFNNKDRTIHDFFESGLTPSSEKLYGGHPTQKPTALLDHLISILSNEGDTILDPFMGSGSTGVSAKKLRRNFIGIEIDKEYVKVSKKRLKETQQCQFDL